MAHLTHVRIADTAAALLCGGQSSRMGFDKAFLKDENGAYLLAKNAAALQTLFERVILVADRREKLNSVADASLEIAEDIYPGSGPLGGMITALKSVPTPYVFIMACDMPQADFSLIPDLHRQLGQSQVALYEHNSRMEPLFAFYHQSCVPMFEEQLLAGKAQPRRAFDRMRVNAVSLSLAQAQDAFVNLNTPEEYAQWLHQRSNVQS